MIKTESKNIDGHEVKSTQLPAMRSLKLKARLGRVAGPAVKELGAVAGDLADWKDDDDVDFEKLAPALMALAANLDDATVDELFPQILASTTIVKDNRQIELDSSENINNAFTGNLNLMFKVVAFALKVNFSDFLLGAVGDAAQSKAPKAARRK